MSSPATIALDCIQSTTLPPAAQLINYPPVASHETVLVLGYYSPSDGGGGEFYWDSTSITTPDGGSVIASTTTPTGRWIRVFSNFQISVKAFGATGNNATDDSAAINAASAYCATLVNNRPSSATLYFPPALGYVTSVKISVKSYISVWMESFLNLNDATFSNICLEIGESGIANNGLDCRLNINNRIASPWGSFLGCIGVNFINLNGSNVKIDHIQAFTIGCQLSSDVACNMNTFYLGSLIDNQRAFNFTSSGPGFVNENVFINGNYSCTSNTAVAPYNSQSRWGVYALAPGSMNQNVFYKPCFQLGASGLLANSANLTGVGSFTLSGGVGYTNGTYQNILLTGGTGTGATANFTVVGGKVTMVALTSVGIGFTVGDVLTAAIGSFSTAFSITVTTLVVAPTAISTFTFVPGSGYTNGTYPNIPLTGGSGSRAVAQIIVSGGVITSIQFTNPGIGYKIGDQLSASSGFTATNFITVASLAVSQTAIAGYNVTNQGSGYTAGIYPNVGLTGGSGSGAIATITVAGGIITKVQLTSIGIGYIVGDVLSANASSIGGTGINFALTVSTLTGGPTAIPVYLDNAKYFSFNNCRVESCSNTIVQVRNSAAGNSFTIDYFNNLSILDPEVATDDTSVTRNTLMKFNWLPETTGADTLIYQSQFLVNALAPYGANLYNIKGLDWVKNTDGSVVNGSTLTSIGPDYIEISAADAYSPGITINTLGVKRFLVKYDSLAYPPGYGGRIFINCYDSNNTIIDPAVQGDLVLWDRAPLAKSTLFGKSYGLQSDINPALGSNFFLNVAASVAKIRIIFTFGTQNLKLRQFSVYSLDGKSQSGYASDALTSDFIGFASGVPTVTYPKGTFVKNDFSSDFKSQFWYNTNGLSTGWKTSNDFNNLTNNPIFSGAGVPNGVVTAPVGSLYLNTTGGAGTTLYVKESGTGNTGWVAK